MQQNSIQALENVISVITKVNFKLLFQSFLVIFAIKKASTFLSRNKMLHDKIKV